MSNEIEEISNSNFTLIPFALSAGIIEKELKKIHSGFYHKLKDDERSFPPFEAPESETPAVLQRFDIKISENPITVIINDEIYVINLLHLFYDEKKVISFREVNYVILDESIYFGFSVIKQDGTMYRDQNQTITHFLFIATSIPRSKLLIKNIDAVLHKLNTPVEIFEVDLSERDFETINRQINSRRIKTRYIVIGEEGVEDLSITGHRPQNIVRLLNDGGIGLEEHRRDGYIQLSDSNEVYGHLTRNGGLYIRNRVQILDALSLSISTIIPRVRIGPIIMSSERIQELLEATRDS